MRQQQQFLKHIYAQIGTCTVRPPAVTAAPFNCCPFNCSIMINTSNSARTRPHVHTHTDLSGAVGPKEEVECSVDVAVCRQKQVSEHVLAHLRPHHSAKLTQCSLEHQRVVMVTILLFLLT